MVRSSIASNPTIKKAAGFPFAEKRPLFSDSVSNNKPTKTDLIYRSIQERARRIAARFPTPSFYIVYERQLRASRLFFETDPILVKIRELTEMDLKGSMGHGRKHAAKVTLDAGALMLIEGKTAGYRDGYLRRRVLLTQCAGLLHDVKRKGEEHAVKGAEHARELLKIFSFSSQEIEDVAIAIRNHEAFKELSPIDTKEGTIVSDCLYDADKFRWGPDNFTDTVWEMVRYHQTPLADFVKFYPRGMEMVQKIKGTFRSQTGKAYGPEIIDLGIEMGGEIYKMIQQEFVLYP